MVSIMDHRVIRELVNIKESSLSPIGSVYALCLVRIALKMSVSNGYRTVEAL